MKFHNVFYLKNLKTLASIQHFSVKLKKIYFIAYEKAARDQRMRAEISQAKKEASFYLENVGKGKAITAMKERREKKKRKIGETTGITVSQKHNLFQLPSSVLFHLSLRYSLKEKM